MARVSTAPGSLAPLQAVTLAPRRCRTRSRPTPRRARISLWITLIEAVYNPPLTAANAFPIAEKGDDDRNRSHLGSGHTIRVPILRIATTPPVWAACLAAFQQELTPQQFATWIRPLACADDAGRLKLTAPNRFVLQWVKDRFGSRIEALVREANGTPVSVDFLLAEAPASASGAVNAPSSTPTQKAPTTVDTLPRRPEPAVPATARVVSTRKTDV